MGKRHPNIPAWQWRSNPQSHQSTTHQAINLIAMPMLVIAFLLLVSGVFSENATSAVIGLVALFAALVLQHQGRKLEAAPRNSEKF
ncbi:terminase [Pseudomonas kulmbachensis]|uniref:terminase n=1 Tax=Pseudomonas kulmbachensis TaxID=3043408 RepID=UPI002AB323BD|nr:terminase [Pseudomonas sp. FLM 004-28]